MLFATCILSTVRPFAAGSSDVLLLRLSPSLSSNVVHWDSAQYWRVGAVHQHLEIEDLREGGVEEGNIGYTDIRAVLCKSLQSDIGELSFFSNFRR